MYSCVLQTTIKVLLSDIFVHVVNPQRKVLCFVFSNGQFMGIIKDHILSLTSMYADYFRFDALRFKIYT